MQLKWFHVTEFQSVRNSGRIDVGEITCLVGKNEAGKSALLKALYRLNPVVTSDGNFDVTRDYPRMDVEDYRHDVETRKRPSATPISVGYDLEEAELEAIQAVFGSECLSGSELTLSKNYENKRTFTLSLIEEKALVHLVGQADLSEQARESLGSIPLTVKDLTVAFQALEQTAEVLRVLSILTTAAERGLSCYVFDTFLKPREPKYFYFDEYYQMTGHENVELMMQRESSNALKASDHPLLGLIKLARLKLPELIDPASTIELKSKLEGASNHLSGRVLRYWSQNRHLRMTFDVRPARPGDPADMQSGHNIWGGVYDTRHQVTTELGSRSRGFVWFFSFLAWYSDVKRSSGPMILLLDEPGLTLHAKAQEDLLRYFETELKGSHQLIYSTHSPFMIDPAHFERVRIVQDKGMDSEVGSELEPAGTEVSADAFAASPDSLFPLQAALGYEIHQTLFVGPYTVVVEGAADLLFMQAMSALLQREGRAGLDPRWTITPVGGAAKVPTFVALLGAQKGMTIATLIDSQLSDRPKIDGLFKEKLLKKANVFTFTEFTNLEESDIEDMFSDGFYLELVNAEFANELRQPIEISLLNAQRPRILSRIEEYLKTMPLKRGSFGHYRPARYFAENLEKLAPSLSQVSKDRFQMAFDALNGLIK